MVSAALRYFRAGVRKLPGETPVTIPQPGHFDYDMRHKTMDTSGINVSIVSRTAPNVFWGSREVSCEATPKVERQHGGPRRR
jgi:hypothetical protein